MEDREGERYIVAKLLIANISNKSGLLKAYPLKVSNETRWDKTKWSVDMCNPLKTQVKPALVCSVDRAQICKRGLLLSAVIESLNC